MDEGAPRLYVFNGLTLAPARACLLRDGEPVSLRPKAFDALLYLVEHRSRLVTKDELISALWPKVVVTDDSLVKCIQDVRLALGDEARGLIKTVPRRGYIFDAAVAVEEGAPAAGGTELLVDEASAAPDRTTVATATNDVPAEAHSAAIAASLQRRSTDREPRRRTRHFRLASAAVLGAAAIGIAAYYLLVGAGDGTSEIAPLRAQSVAVLPFVSISPDPDQDYFSDGVSEELLNVLANIPGLHVPSRTSSFAFKGTSTDLRTIAAALGVAHVLEGSVRKAGDEVRITAQLIDVATDSHLWSATYDRELTNIFAVQDEIARNVAMALQVSLLAGELPRTRGSRTQSIEAHDAFLVGLQHLSTQRSEEISLARASFERAVELDPSYAAAYSELGTTLLTAQGYGLMDRDEALDAAAHAIARALELDPNLSDAHLANGQLHLFRYEYALADAAYQRAIALRPGLARAYFGRLYSLGGLGRLDEARFELQKALDLDPLNALLNWNMGNVQLALGDTAAADAYYRRAVQFEPSQPNAYAGLGDVAIARGRLDEALRWYLDGTEQDPGHPHITAIVGLIYNALGDRERAQSWFDKAAGMLQVGSLPKLFREFVPLVVRNEDPDALLAALREVPAGQFGAFGSRLFRKAALRTGDTTGTEGFYRQNWPELFAAEPPVGASNFGAATDVAWLLMARGEAERSERLLNRALEVFHDPSQRRIDPPDWALVLVETEALALLGRKSDALAALRRAVDGGWRWDWWQVENDPTLASIRREPEFVAMIEEVKADLATQRERVREIERSDASRVVTGAEDEAR